MSQANLRHFKIELIIYKLSFKCDKIVAYAAATCRYDSTVIELVQHRDIRNNIAYFYEAIKMPLVCIQVDAAQQKYIKRVIDIQFQYGSQALLQKLGTAQVDLADILNSRKTRIPLDIPLKKCYDKNAYAKISVDFNIIGDQAQLDNIVQANKPMRSEQIKNSFMSALQPAEQQQTVIRKDSQASSRHISQQFKSKKRTNQQNKQQIHSLQLKIINLQSQNKKFIQKLKFSQDEIKSYKLANQNFLQSTTAILNQRSILLTKIKQIEQQNQFFREKISEVNITRQTFMNMEAKVAELENINQKLQTDLQNNQIILDDTTRAKQKLIQVYQFLLEEKNKIAGQANQLKLQVEQLRQDKQVMRTTIVNLTKKDEAKQRHLIEQRQKYTQKMKEMQEDKANTLLQIQTNARIQLQNKENFYRQSLKKNEERLKQLNSTNNQRQRQLSDKIISFKEKIKLLQEANQKLQSENKQLTSKTQNLQNQAILLNSKLAESKARQLQLSSELESMRTSLRLKQRQISILKQHNQSLMNKIQQYKVQTDYTNQTFSEQNRKIACLQNQIEFVRKQLDLNERNTKLQQLKREKQIQRILKENNFLNCQLIKVKSQLTIMNDRLNQQSDKIGAKKETVLILQSEKQNAKRQIMHLEHIRVQLQSQNKRLKMDLKQLEQTLQQYYERDKNLSHSMVQPRDKMAFSNVSKRVQARKYHLLKNNRFEALQQDFQSDAQYTISKQIKRY